MLQRLIGLFLFSVVPLIVAAGDDFPEFKLRGLIDLRVIASDTTPSWLDRGLGKLRYGGDSAGTNYIGAELAEAALAISSRFSWDITGRLVLKYDPDQNNVLDVLEGFIAYKPITTSAYRFKSRIGIFFPPLSLENEGLAWTSPYSITPSAINSWIGEEVRTLGAETSLTKLGEDDRYTVTVALYKANDPTGSLLAYRGWAIHDRKVGLFDRVPLAPITPFQVTKAFESQAPWVAPFRELDGRWGYYLAADWKHLDIVELRALYYDNQADPSVLSGGQYAWHTRFTSIGLKLELDHDLDILLQYLTGNTQMGGFQRVQKSQAVDNDFSAFYVLVSRRINNHRLTLRYDSFEVKDIDNGVVVPYDLNDDKGDAWTFAYLYRVQRHQSLILEVIQLNSKRAARAQIGSITDITETLLQASYRFFL